MQPSFPPSRRVAALCVLGPAFIAPLALVASLVAPVRPFMLAAIVLSAPPCAVAGLLVLARYERAAAASGAAAAVSFVLLSLLGGIGSEMGASTTLAWLPAAGALLAHLRRDELTAPLSADALRESLLTERRLFANSGRAPAVVAGLVLVGAGALMFASMVGEQAGAGRPAIPRWAVPIVLLAGLAVLRGGLRGADDAAPTASSPAPAAQPEVPPGVVVDDPRRDALVARLSDAMLAVMPTAWPSATLRLDLRTGKLSFFCEQLEDTRLASDELRACADELRAFAFEGCRRVEVSAKAKPEGGFHFTVDFVA